MKLSLAIPALLTSIVAGEGGLRAVQQERSKLPPFKNGRRLHQIQKMVNGERRLMEVEEFDDEDEFLAAIVKLTTKPNAPYPSRICDDCGGKDDHLLGSTCFLYKEEFGDDGAACANPAGGCGAADSGTGIDFPALEWHTNTCQKGPCPSPDANPDPFFSHADEPFDSHISKGKFHDQVDREVFVDGKPEFTKFKYPALEAWGATFILDPKQLGQGLNLDLYCEDQLCGGLEDIETLGGVFRGYIAKEPIAYVKIKAGSLPNGLNGPRQETYDIDNFWIFPWCSPIRDGIKGDPHVETWTGEYFDFMGECDLVYLEDEEQDIDIHARTTIRYDYSYVESAAVRIGKDIMEVSSFGQHSVNGVDGVFFAGTQEPVTLGGYPVYYSGNKRRHKFDIVLGTEKNITVGAFKDLVYATVKGDESVVGFEKSKGIMGNVYGHLLGRDGTTEYKIKDQASMDAFGQEWQVGPEDRKLFRTDRAPQYPATCTFPSKSVKDHRRLAESPVELIAAEKACAGFAGDTFQKCVYDVMAYGDLEVATSGMY